MSALTHKITIVGDAVGSTERRNDGQYFPEMIVGMSVNELIMLASDAGWRVAALDVFESLPGGGDRKALRHYGLTFQWDQTLLSLRSLALIFHEGAAMQLHAHPPVTSELEATLVGSRPDEAHGTLQRAGWSHLITGKLPGGEMIKFYTHRFNASA